VSSTLARCSSTASCAHKARKPLELFIRREDAERFLDELREDEPGLAELLSVEAVDLDA
jgi:hypothetical protein